MAARRKYITIEECQKCNGDLKDDLKTIKNALIGENMRGGLVQQVNELATTLQDLITDKSDEKKDVDDKKVRSQRWKIAAFTAFAGILGIFLGHFLQLL